MRKPQEIKVVVHYPRTEYGWYSLMMRIVFSNPDLVYDRIKALKVTKKKKDELLKIARTQTEMYHDCGLNSYKRHRAANDEP